ncbi:hypothetical protein IBL26_24690 [Roseomonas aerophila]|uniref:Uncharacterized protein n=2 Tax=Teichococcus aerophilus TaxID=1224513 RepID=A0ABR7RUS9_9PROT|nr:hypothetical protein [Pseudoroseomonas aerophila]
MRADLILAARLALRDQTPECLAAYSVDVDIPRHLLKMRAHCASQPSEEEMEDLFCAETEIFSYYFDDTFVETEIEVLAPGAEPNFLPGGVAYRRSEQQG